MSARLSARGVSIRTRGAGALQSPAQNSREDRDGWYRRKVALVAGAGGGLGARGAAVVCADIDGAAPETAVAQIRAIGGRPTGIARAERSRPFSSPRGGTTAVFRGSRVLAVAVNRLWRKFNYNLLGRF